jgi:hypothetical protein
MNEKTVLHQNTTNAGELRGNHKRQAEIYQGIYDAHEALGLKASIAKVSELRIHNPEEYVREAIYRENQMLQSLPLKKEAVLQMIELPAAFSAFVTAVNGLKWADRFLGAIEERFINIENGRVLLSPDFEQWVTDKTSTYATEEEAQALQEAKDIFDQLQDFQQKYDQVRILPAEIENSPTLFYSVKGKVKMRGLSVRTTND